MIPGTTDLASISIKKLDPYVRLSEIVSGQGSLSGSQRLTDIFTSFVASERARDIGNILAGRGFSEQELLAGLSDQFERIKPRLSAGRARTLVRSDVWHHSQTGEIESQVAELALSK